MMVHIMDCRCAPRFIGLKPQPPSVMVFGDGAFRRWLGLDEVMRMAPLCWDQCPYKKRHQRACSLFPFPSTVSTERRGCVSSLQDGGDLQVKRSLRVNPTLPALCSWTSPPPELWVINFCGWNHLAYSILLWQLWQYNTVHICVLCFSGLACFKHSHTTQTAIGPWRLY